MTDRFKHKQIDIGYEELEVLNTPNGRRYITPNGDSYASITTILGSIGKESLNEWREAVGEEEANRICHHAATRGTAMHDITERYLNNEREWFKSTDMPHTRALFNSIRPILDRNVKEIFLQEKPLYSDLLRTAGRVDLIADFNGTLSIVDFKTSRRRKTSDGISNYFQQATAYALMFEERTGIKINQIVIVMAVDDDRTPIVFIEKTKHFIKPLFETIQKYYSQHK